jgi:hypothetical protein
MDLAPICGRAGAAAVATTARAQRRPCRLRVTEGRHVSAPFPANVWPPTRHPSPRPDLVRACVEERSLEWERAEVPCEFSHGGMVTSRADGATLVRSVPHPPTEKSPENPRDRANCKLRDNN